MKNKSVLLSVLTVICIITTVILWFPVNSYEPDYTEVKATVVSSQTRTVRTKQTKRQVYEVVVEYEGTEYELNNVHGTAGYPVGRTITALAANGKLYANVEGIKSTTPLAIVYFVFLFLSLGMLSYTIFYISNASKKKKAADTP